MQFYLYRIQVQQLKPFIEYILFNYHDNNDASGTVTSFANTNICLGIIKGKELVQQQDGLKTVQEKNDITAYLSGIYLAPHRFQARGQLDEICINFSPWGYYQLFKIPLQTYIFQEDILAEAFGSSAKFFFEKVFEESSFQKRGELIEHFLLRRIQQFEHPFLQQCLGLIQTSESTPGIRELQRHLKCSEKKLYRTFKNYLDLSPKAYLRIVKFRKALQSIYQAPPKMLTGISYDTGFYDQSHLIKDFRFFTENTPKAMQQKLQNVGETVLITVT